MSRLTKIMLGLMIVNIIATMLFLTGIVDISGFPGLYAVFPLAAVFYGMFLISLMMQKETARFEADKHTHHDYVAPEEIPQNIKPLHDHDHDQRMAA